MICDYWQKLGHPKHIVDNFCFTTLVHLSVFLPRAAQCYMLFLAVVDFSTPHILIIAWWQPPFMVLHSGLTLSSVDQQFFPTINQNPRQTMLHLPTSLHLVLILGQNGKYTMRHLYCPLHLRMLQHIGNRYAFQLPIFQLQNYGES